MNAAISIEGLSAGYGRHEVLHDISMEIPAGQMVGVLGPNGAGKTTLFKVLTGLLAPQKGHARLFGRDIRSLSPLERARTVAVVPQEVSTPMPFTVRDVVMIGRTASLSRWTRPTPEDHRIVERAMAYTDVVELQDRPLEDLSGGEKQRAVVAMALAQEPRIILMDEATSHLDINHRLEIMQIVERLTAEQGLTVLMTSHDLNLAAEFCRRLALLEGGRLLADGPPEDVLSERTLRQVYHCDIRVSRDEQSGMLSVVPARRLGAPATAGGLRVHVIAGGGSGSELLRRLHLCGYVVSCGVLNRGDTDAQVAAALNLPTALEKPFSPVGPEALLAALDLAESADAVVVAELPFGPGNLVNLRVPEQALSDGHRVLVVDRGLEQRDYTPGREAVTAVRTLIARGATPCSSIADVLQALAGAEQPEGAGPGRQGR